MFSEPQTWNLHIPELGILYLNLGRVSVSFLNCFHIATQLTLFFYFVSWRMSLRAEEQNNILIGFFLTAEHQSIWALCDLSSLKNTNTLLSLLRCVIRTLASGSGRDSAETPRWWGVEEMFNYFKPSETLNLKCVKLTDHTHLNELLVGGDWYANEHIWLTHLGILIFYHIHLNLKTEQLYLEDKECLKPPGRVQKFNSK